MSVVKVVHKIVKISTFMNGRDLEMDSSVSCLLSIGTGLIAIHSMASLLLAVKDHEPLNVGSGQ